MQVLVSSPFNVKNDLAFVQFCGAKGLEVTATEDGRWMLKSVTDKVPTDQELEGLAPLLDTGESVVFTGASVEADTLTCWTWALAWNGQYADRDQMNRWIRERFISNAAVEA